MVSKIYEMNLGRTMVEGKVFTSRDFNQPYSPQALFVLSAARGALRDEKSDIDREEIMQLLQKDEWRKQGLDYPIIVIVESGMEYIVDAIWDGKCKQVYDTVKDGG
jgi:hypothetical protein